MLASVGSFFVRRSVEYRVAQDAEALLARMRRRVYPETLPVLASFWLKTVCTRGYGLGAWKELSRHLEAIVRGPLEDDCRAAIADIDNWIHQNVISAGQIPEWPSRRPEPMSTNLKPEGLAAYTVRLLNQWLPLEVARLLVDRSESRAMEEDGVPAWIVGSALERLLVREHLSRGTLQMFIEPRALSPESVYPADLEMLRDAALSLLGVTQAPNPAVLPATLLCVGDGARLPADYREAVRRAKLVPRTEGEEVHVPLSSEHARELLADETVHFGSIIVTMDGRMWESQSLQSGEDHFVVYRPSGACRINYCRDHAEIRAPWPQDRLRWSGVTHCRGTFKIFGREWRPARWVVDSERTWIDLVFSRVLPISEMAPSENREAWRLRPASVDMGWAALEKAVLISIAQQSLDAVERLRQTELIPLGRAMVGLAEAISRGRSNIHGIIETHLKALRYMESPVLSSYGRVPWRILPAPVREAFLRVPLDAAQRELLNEVIEGVPETAHQRSRNLVFNKPRSTSPHAA